jgi:exodeoxyribonuclease V beta subunit
MSMLDEARAFDLRGPLPTGVSVLEASAGTGKTYTIAGLAARYVAAGYPLDQILLVTFTRIATGELRERVRERLLAVKLGLERALAGRPASRGDPVIELLSAGSASELSQRRARLAQALAAFDAATIATTHQFCREVLVGMGIAADLEPDVAFVEDLRDLVADVVEDLYVRKFHKASTRELSFTQARAIAQCAIDNPGAEIVTGDGEIPRMHASLARAAREELERRKHRMAVIGYDDLLTRLDTALSTDQYDVAERLRARYKVVLVDEFQDTDLVQWRIMRRAFAESGTLVLIADPKQAIYAFRGADVYSYLEAATAASRRATLEVNWRSDQGLIDAYDALFAGARLGHEGIVYRQVRAATANVAPRLSGARVDTPLRVRIVPRERIDCTPGGYAKAPAARDWVADDLAADVVALLGSGARLEARDEHGAAIGSEEVQPGDVAVLVQTNRSAALIREALERVGVPAVINGAGSVFGTETAGEWLRLLEALERPASGSRAHSAALTCFLGFSPEQVAEAEEDTWGELHRRLHEWARVLRVRGVASLLEVMMLREGLPARLLATADGERRMTDLRHVAQLLHEAASAEQSGTTALAAWLRRRIAEAGEDTGDEERSRRLESDAAAVQVLTIHRSKGLEFPIVYVPFLWEPGHIPREARPVVFHDPEAADARTIDVALEGPEFAAHRQQQLIEQRGEDLRLAYVALTRARHQAVIWWAGSWSTRDAPLTRLLFARAADGSVAPGMSFTPSDASAAERLEEMAARAPGRVAVERGGSHLPAEYGEALPPVTELTVAKLRRSLDRRWRRTSYSDLTAAAHDALVASEPEQAGVTDEPADSGAETPAGVPEPGADAALLAPVLLDAMAMGPAVGTLVHRLFEASDFAAADLDAELTRHLRGLRAGRSLELGDERLVIAGLRAAIETPLGPLLDGRRLRDVERPDRLDELTFELPLAGGDQPRGWLDLRHIGDLLREHVAPGDPLRAYAERLADPTLAQRARGFLTGSLDLVVRVNGPDGPRFAVIDYKTNRLGSSEEPLLAWHHRPAALVHEMLRRHYGLQALLYTVALHRYLRWRLPGYMPERHLAGVLYLFLRGMTGAGTPVIGGHPCGVFAWAPPAPLAVALSDALDEGTP